MNSDTCVWTQKGGVFAPSCRPEMESREPVSALKGYGYCKWCGCKAVNVYERDQRRDCK